MSREERVPANINVRGATTSAMQTFCKRFGRPLQTFCKRETTEEPQNGAKHTARDRSVFGAFRPYLLSFAKLEPIGAAGFEPATPCSQSRCATKLRHAPYP
jgi:hypothetical protein